MFVFCCTHTHIQEMSKQERQIVEELMMGTRDCMDHQKSELTIAFKKQVKLHDRHPQTTKGGCGS